MAGISKSLENSNHLWDPKDTRDFSDDQNSHDPLHSYRCDQPKTREASPKRKGKGKKWEDGKRRRWRSLPLVHEYGTPHPPDVSQSLADYWMNLNQNKASDDQPLAVGPVSCPGVPSYGGGENVQDSFDTIASRANDNPMDEGFFATVECRRLFIRNVPRRTETHVIFSFFGGNSHVYSSTSQFRKDMY